MRAGNGAGFRLNYPDRDRGISQRKRLRAEREETLAEEFGVVRCGKCDFVAEGSMFGRPPEHVD